MAGGQGQRLRPLTCDRPKPLVPVCNRPVIGYTLDLLAEHGVQEVFLTTGYMPEAIPRLFGDSYRGMRLHYRAEPYPLGTAGSVAALRPELDDTFLVLSGDALTDVDLSALVAFHRRSDALVTLGLTQVANPLSYGVVLTDSRGRIRRFREKPGWGEAFSDTVNTGIYVLESGALDGVPPGRSYDFSRHLFPSLLQMEAPLFGFVLDGYWCDIGDPRSYLQANLDLLERRLRFSPPGQEVLPGVWAEGDVRLEAPQEGPALIGQGCRVMAGARLQGGVVLGPGTVVGQNCSLSRTVTWDEVRLEPGTTLMGAVVCTGSAVGPNGAVYDGAVVGRNCRIGTGAAVAPGVRLWPASFVEDRAVAEASPVRSARWRAQIIRSGSLRGTLGQDLFPDQVMRIGSAFAAVLEPGGPVVAGSDPGEESGLVRQALICGLLAAGRDVVDAGATASPVTAYLGSREQAAGALHVFAREREVRVGFLGAGGVPVGRELQKRLEQACTGREYLWGVSAEAGRLHRASQAEEQFLNSLARQVDVEAIRSAAFAVQVEGQGWPLLYRWLGRLGCRLRECSAHADVAVVVDTFEGRWRLEGVDHSGMLSLNLWLKARAQPLGAEVPLPPTVPRTLERFLRQHGWRPKPVPLAQWRPTDPILGISLLLDWLARDRLTLGEALGSLPQAHVATAEVPCPWQGRGRIMRRLIEIYQSELEVLTDGLQVSCEDGRALLLPDPDEPHWQIVTEADSPAAAAALLRRMTAQLTALIPSG